LPITSKRRGVPSHVPVLPPEGGLKTLSYIMCEAVRSIAKERLVRRFAHVSQTTIEAVEDRLRILTGL